MTTVQSFKMTHDTKKFNKNQRVFIIYQTGAAASYCYGRFRGRHRWIKAWVRYDNDKYPIPVLQTFEVDSDCHIAKICGPVETERMI